MDPCSMCQSDSGKEWPESVVSVRMTMSPYVFAMAIEAAMKSGVKPWEFINVAIWEKLGKPDHDTLMQFAANMDIDDEDPKWKKRLKITARHETAMDDLRRERAEQTDDPEAP